jgi:hypothetical protein
LGKIFDLKQNSTNFCGVGNNRAILQNAKYTDTNASPKLCESLFLGYPCSTNFPKGFDPQARGMVKVN